MNKVLKYDLVQAMAAPLTAKDIKPQAVSECLACVKTYTGKISDEKGVPLSGATLFNLRSKTGTITNSNGDFNLKALPSDPIEIRTLGLQTQIILAKNLPPLLKMQEEEMALEEVVVTHTPPKKEVVPSYNIAVKKSKKWLWIGIIIASAGVIYGVTRKNKNSNENKKPKKVDL